MQMKEYKKSLKISIKEMDLYLQERKLNRQEDRLRIKNMNECIKLYQQMIICMEEERKLNDKQIASTMLRRKNIVEELKNC